MSIKDWASKVAERINVEYAPGRVLPSVDHIAAIIATSAKPLLDLLEPRQHYHCQDSWYCCGKCTYGCPYDHDHNETCYPSSLNFSGDIGWVRVYDHKLTLEEIQREQYSLRPVITGCVFHGGESPRKSGVCDCGADIYNMNLKTAFSGLPDSSRDNKQKHT